MPDAFTSTELVWVTFPGNCFSDCDQEISGASIGKPVPSGEDLAFWLPNGVLPDAHPAPSLPLLYGQRCLWLPGPLGILEAR